MAALPRRSTEDIVAGLTEKAPSLEGLSPREQLVALVESVSGLGADRPEEQELWLSIVCPERKHFLAKGGADAAAYGNVSDFFVEYSCGLVARSHLRRLGFRDERIGLDEDGTRHPYRWGKAIDDVVESCKKHEGAHTTDAASVQLGAGLLLIIGDGLSTHATAILSRDGDRIVTGDGGQIAGWCQPRGKPYQCIRTIERTLRSVRGVPHLDDRPIRHVIFPEALPRPEGATIDSV